MRPDPLFRTTGLLEFRLEDQNGIMITRFRVGSHLPKRRKAKPHTKSGRKAVSVAAVRN
jgi:hypothetical protein